MMIVSIDDDGKPFAKFQVTDEDLTGRVDPNDQVIKGHDEVVRFVESIGGLEIDSSGIDRIEKLFNKILEVGVQIGIEKSKRKLTGLLG